MAGNHKTRSRPASWATWPSNLTQNDSRVFCRRGIARSSINPRLQVLAGLYDDQGEVSTSRVFAPWDRETDRMVVKRLSLVIL